MGSRRFGALFATQFLSAFNDNALKNALVLMLAYRPEMAEGMAAFKERRSPDFPGVR